MCNRLKALLNGLFGFFLRRFAEFTKLNLYLHPNQHQWIGSSVG